MKAVGVLLNENISLLRRLWIAVSFALIALSARTLIISGLHLITFQQDAVFRLLDEYFSSMLAIFTFGGVLSAFYFGFRESAQYINSVSHLTVRSGVRTGLKVTVCSHLFAMAAVFLVLSPLMLLSIKELGPGIIVAILISVPCSIIIGAVSIVFLGWVTLPLGALCGGLLAFGITNR